MLNLVTRKFLTLRIIGLCIAIVTQSSASFWLIKYYSLETFGFWALLLSTSSLISFLDFGMLWSTGNRLIAKFAREELDEFEEMFKEIANAIFILIKMLLIFSPMIFFLVLSNSNLQKAVIVSVVLLCTTTNFLIRLLEVLSRSQLMTIGYQRMVIGASTELVAINILFAFRAGLFEVFLVIFFIRATTVKIMANDFDIKHLLLSVAKSNWDAGKKFFSGEITTSIQMLGFALGFLLVNDLSAFLIAHIYTLEILSSVALGRLFSGSIRQFAGVLVNSFSTSFTLYVSTKSKEQIKINLMKMIGIYLGFCVVAALCTMALIDVYRSAISIDTTQFSDSLVIAFLIYGSMDGLWTVLTVVPVSVNKSESISTKFVVLGAFSLPVVMILISYFGAIGFPLGFLPLSIYLVVEGIKRSLTIIGNL